MWFINFIGTKHNRGWKYNFCKICKFLISRSSSGHCSHGGGPWCFLPQIFNIAVLHISHSYCFFITYWQGTAGVNRLLPMQDVRSILLTLRCVQLGCVFLGASFFVAQGFSLDTNVHHSISRSCYRTAQCSRSASVDAVFELCADLHCIPRNVMPLKLQQIHVAKNVHILNVAITNLSFTLHPPTLFCYHFEAKQSLFCNLVSVWNQRLQCSLCSFQLKLTCINQLSLPEQQST